MLWLKKIADNREQTSLASSLRRKRFGFFVSLLERLEKPVRILDVGGTQRFWEVMAFTAGDGIEITLLNLTLEPVNNPNFTSVIGDALSMSQIADQYFDVVFSNSIIEHVGEYEDQRRMAEEIKRVGKRYFVQTPNRYFPLEPHFFVSILSVHAYRNASLAGKPLQCRLVSKDRRLRYGHSNRSCHSLVEEN